MTYREKLEARLERREEWADKAQARSDARFQIADRMASVIPMGQPILVGHHSESRDRNYRDRIHNNMAKAVEQMHLAEHHTEKAAGVERQLERSVFSDDPDAIESLQAKIADAEALQARMTAANKIVRKHKGDPMAGQAALEAAGFTATQAAELFKPDFCGRLGFPGYALTNNSANIRRLKGRIEEVQRRQQRTADAEAAGGVAIQQSSDGKYCNVTFAEKPERSILDALKAAGFHWGAGCWSGCTENLPSEVKELLATA